VVTLHVEPGAPRLVAKQVIFGTFVLPFLA
jgi:hypothetical protein